MIVNSLSPMRLQCGLHHSIVLDQLEIREFNETNFKNEILLYQKTKFPTSVKIVDDTSSSDMVGLPLFFFPA